MKFLADMGISPKSVLYLRTQGYDARHLLDERLNRLPDPLILEKALNEDRILLTHDLDFADLLAASAATLPSVMIFRLRNMRPEQVNHYLKMILTKYSEELQLGAIVSITEAQIRVRRLPIEK